MMSIIRKANILLLFLVVVVVVVVVVSTTAVVNYNIGWFATATATDTAFSTTSKRNNLCTTRTTTTTTTHDDDDDRNNNNVQKPSTYHYFSSSTSSSLSSSWRIIGSLPAASTTTTTTTTDTTTNTNDNPLLDVVTRYIPRGGAGSGSNGNSSNGCVVDFLRGVDMFGTGLFAFSGALTAGRKGMDLLGMMIVAMITATGGGTVRDILMNQGPIFWLQDSIYVKIATAVTIATFCLWPKLEQRFDIKDSAKVICYADAICLGTFAIVGTQKAVNLQLQPTLWIVSGLLTAVFGGITRDILCLQRPRVMYPERTMYGVPPLLGSAVYAWLISSSQNNNNNNVQIIMDGRKAACISIMVTFITRVLSFDNPRRLPHWKMPTDE